MVQAGERVTVEEGAQLQLALGLRQAEVHVEDVYGAIEVVVADADFAVQHAAPLAPADRQVDVGHGLERPPAEDRVAVLAATADLDVGEPGAVGEAELIAEQVDLAIAVGARHALIDLLQQDQVRLVVRHRRDDPLGPVAPVEAADALVDVVGQDADTHRRGDHTAAGRAAQTRRHGVVAAAVVRIPPTTRVTSSMAPAPPW